MKKIRRTVSLTPDFAEASKAGNRTTKVLVIAKQEAGWFFRSERTFPLALFSKTSLMQIFAVGTPRGMDLQRPPLCFSYRAQCASHRASDCTLEL